jgi:dynein heavy chain
LNWKDIENTVLIAAAAPPGGGRSNLTIRFTRHFNIFNVPDSNEESLRDIFSSIFKNFIKVKLFKKEIYELAEGNFVV